MDFGWIFYALVATFFLGLMNGIRGLFPNISSEIILFIFGATWLLYFSFVIMKDFSVIGRVLISLGYLIILAGSIALIPDIGFWPIFWIVFSAIISAIGNRALFKAIQIASPNSGYPLAVLSLFAVVAQIVGICFVSGGPIAIKFAGWSGVWINIQKLSAIHLAALVFGVLCAALFSLAKMELK